MKKNLYKEVTGILFLICLTLISGCDKKTPLNPGFLKGTISIGPICPVETIPPSPACQPTAETYKAYPVGVYTPDGSRKIAQLYPSIDGSYIVELQPGNWLVVLEKAKYGPGGSNLPAEVAITAEDDTTLNIDIDTGIR